MITLIIGVGIIILALSISLKQNSIKRTGLITDGIVYDLSNDPNSSFNIRYPVIRFLTQTQEWITETANVGIFPGFYKKGQKVTVIYDQKNPKQFIIDSKTNRAITYLILIVGVLLTLSGAYQLIRIKL
jgi:Protein of unknown function (DUF3592)